ncbi:asparagine synthase (glutamine-hydrolyzing) [Candidatus Latescibacterota bacterium]
MCGLAGKHYGARGGRPDDGLLHRMCETMRHRGPDEGGVHVEGSVGLCMRRLRVIDVEGGQQPMCNEDGTLWLVFNGEIYNHSLLRVELESRGHVFSSRSDTETILHLYEENGVDCLRRLRGMFALALWDVPRQQLVLARDRLGKKPLYYSHNGQSLSFASELSTLVCDPEVDRGLDAGAVDEYLRYLFVPHPRTIYRGARKLPPGSAAVFRDGRLCVRRYWDLEYLEDRQPGEAREAMEEVLREAVALRMVADVPVGAFLSGGLDSSLIVALMQQVSNRTVRTFSIGFEESSYNELTHARTVAQHLGTDHREYVVGYEVRELIPKLVLHFGEPFADSSAIPTYHLSRVTRENVTVALSGDGGDEIFGGYRRYRAGLMAGLYNQWPGWLGRQAIERALGRIREPDSYYGTSLRKRARRFVEFARARREQAATSWDFFFLEGERKSLYTEDFIAMLEARDEPGSYAPYAEAASGAGDQAMLWLDLKTYLSDDILVKVDRMSMACSLEVRSPLLDQEVVELAAKLPRRLKFDWHRSKILLRQIAGAVLPQEVLTRPKQGFAVPLAKWLKSELRPWMEDLLLSSGARSRQLIGQRRSAAMIEEHVAGRRDYSQQLWALMMLEAWLQSCGQAGQPSS